VAVAQALDALGTSYDIISLGLQETSDKTFGHRIKVLTAVRNAVMKPLYDGVIARHMPGKRFDTVLVLNDIIWCTVDVLEVLYQKEERGAYEACSVDWDWNGKIVYDRWVLRTMSGR
jgi:alpha-1,3-mannosyltransferase